MQKQQIKTKSRALTIALIFVVILYIRDHQELNKLKREINGVSANSNNMIDHKKRLDKRRSRLSEICRSLEDPMRVEHSSLFKKKIMNNHCTGTYFKVGGKHHFICNALKSGSTSWEMFFAENKINKTYIADCKYKGCPEAPEIKIIQVRHPFERVISTYRHIFKNGGWKTIDRFWEKDQVLNSYYQKLFSKTFQEFVTDVIINNEFEISEEFLDDVNHPGTWLKTHWAPFWYTCGLCTGNLSPVYILKLETLRWDIPEVLSALGMSRELAFPDIREEMVAGFYL